MTDMELLINEIMRIDGCEVTKRRAVAVLRTQEGKRVYFAKGALTTPQQIKLADELMRRLTRHETRDALIARLGVSRGTAYRLMQAALHQRTFRQAALL